MIDYKIDKKDYETKLDLLQNHGFHFTEDKVYNLTYVWGAKRITIFNKNILNQLIELLEKGHLKDSEEVSSIFKNYEGDLWEFDKGKLHQRQFKSCCTSSRWHRNIMKIIEEDDEQVIFASIPNGDFSDGRPRKCTTYKSVEAVKQVALEYIDKEIEHLKEFREKIISEGV